MTGVFREKSIDTAAIAKYGPFLVGDLDELGLQFQGTFTTDSYDIETSNESGESVAPTDGSFLKIGASVTAAGLVQPTGYAKWLRLNKTAGSAAITVELTGLVAIR